jgi:CMP-N-acetylneuraminic acid synthetase
MNDIIGYDLETISGDHFLQTHSTNPLLTQKTLETAVRSYFEHLDKHDSLFSVTRLQTRLYWGSGKPVNHSPQQLERTQDLPPVYEENSNLYLFSRSSFKNAGNNRIGCNPKMFSMHPLEALDIDEETDFQIAETIYHLKRSRKI